jgi:hypothetical protein
MNVMQTQVTIAWESEKGNITGLTALKGQDSLVFFTHLTGPRRTRSTSPPRPRLLLLSGALSLLQSASRTRRSRVLGVSKTRRTVSSPGGASMFFEVEDRARSSGL